MLGVHLLGCLQDVSPIDKQCGGLARHDRHPRRPGEAGEPGEPLPARRDVLVHVFVGMRNQHGVDAWRAR